MPSFFLLFQPQFAESYHQSTMNVLIPHNFPGKFYYPPCKCELMNQIRYYNPKTKEFYYHKAYTATPPHKSNDRHGGMPSEQFEQKSHQGPYLGGEPEFYPVPAISATNQDGSHPGQHLPSPSLTLPYPYVPSSQYYQPFDRHQMVSI